MLSERKNWTAELVDPSNIGNFIIFQFGKQGAFRRERITVISSPLFAGEKSRNVEKERFLLAKTARRNDSDRPHIPRGGMSSSQRQITCKLNYTAWPLLPRHHEQEGLV